MNEVDKIKIKCFDWLLEHLYVAPGLMELQIRPGFDDGSSFNGLPLRDSDYRTYYEYINAIKQGGDLVFIRDLKLSTRIKNVLIRANINTLEQLKKRSINKLRRIRNLGKGSIKEIKDLLANYGYTLNED